MTVRLSRSVEIAQVARHGFDSLYVDLEHSSLSLERRARSLRGAHLRIAPLVRVARSS
jgi:2-keto-3-deoxy-L-rhamnonate aldolase RhmA